MELPSLAAPVRGPHLTDMNDQRRAPVFVPPVSADGPDRPPRMGLSLPTGRDPLSVRRRVEAMEALLERSMVIPGTSYQVGLDTLVGFIPVIGDLVTAAMGSYIVWEARNLGMPKWRLWQMMGRIGFDTAIGAIPLAGDAFDVVYRSNSKNLRTIRRHLDRNHPETRTIEQ